MHDVHVILFQACHLYKHCLPAIEMRISRSWTCYWQRQPWPSTQVCLYIPSRLMTPICCTAWWRTHSLSACGLHCLEAEWRNWFDWTGPLMLQPVSSVQLLFGYRGVTNSLFYPVWGTTQGTSHFTLAVLFIPTPTSLGNVESNSHLLTWSFWHT